MSTPGTFARAHHIRRPRPTWSRVRAVTQQEYNDLRDCCCHKLGRARPHPAFACRDVD